MYLDRCALKAEELHTVGAFEWRAPRQASTKAVTLAEWRDTHDRPLVRFAGVRSRDAASTFTNGELWADAATLPDPGPGVAYAYQFVGLRVLTPDGRQLGVIREVVFNHGVPLYDVEGMKAMLPGHEPFLKHVDLDAGTVTMDLPAGFEEF